MPAIPVAPIPASAGIFLEAKMIAIATIGHQRTAGNGISGGIKAQAIKMPIKSPKIRPSINLLIS